MSQGAVRRSPGRPRDPEFDYRILAAAREVYSVRGWSGFTLDEVARHARVSKGALYLRWSDKATLILEAVRTQAPKISNIDTGSLRGDLMESAREWWYFITSNDGAMLVRLGVDRRFYPEIDAAFKVTPIPAYVTGIYRLVRRGIERGEVPPTTSASLVGDLVAGAIAVHVRREPESKLTEQYVERFVSDLVTTVLAGLRTK